MVVALLVLAAGTYALRLSGVALLRDGQAPAALAATAPALLAAIVAVSTLVSDGQLVIDSRLPAVVVAGLAAWRRLPFVLVVTLAVATAALLRYFLR